MPEPFHADGLRFACARCSACCRGEPGYVFLTRPDLERLAARFGLALSRFSAEYCIVVDMGDSLRLSLKERRNHDCSLWGEGGCRAYDDRPLQCKTYPFWDSVIREESDWIREGADCPGIGKGQIRDREEIEAAVIARRLEPLISLDESCKNHPERVDENTILGR